MLNQATVQTQFEVQTGQKPRLRGIPHVVGAAVALPGAIVMGLHARAGDLFYESIIYGIGLVMLLGISALYHTPMWSVERRRFMRRLDHAMIYLFIGCSYTPLFSAMGNSTADTVLQVAWLLSGLGVVQTIFWPDAPRFLRTSLYVSVSWIAALFAVDLYVLLGPSGFGLLALGGLAYTVGAVCYAKRWPNPYPGIFCYHEVFHVLVVVAAASHYAAIWPVVT